MTEQIGYSWRMTSFAEQKIGAFKWYAVAAAALLTYLWAILDN